MKPILAVLVGGVVGTGLRLAVDVVLPHGGAVFPLGTFVVNLVGSFALGLAVARLWPRVPAWARAGLGPGLLGSFTTFSALAVSAVELTAAGSAGSALIYVAASVVGGISAAALGLRLGSASPGPVAPVPPIGADE